MSERDIELLFMYMEQLVKGVDKIAVELEIANSYQVTCSDDYVPLNFEVN